MDAKVMILATCKNGHETQMFPQDCLVSGTDYNLECGTNWLVVEWECARCPKDDYECEVEL